jgi:hypothetical protein
MTINLKLPDIRELKPRITVFGVGGAGGNAVNNMVEGGLQGCDFVVANTDAQVLASSKVERVIQMGLQVTGGLGAGSQPDVGRASAEEVIDELRDQLAGTHMCFVTAGMGGGTGTGAAPVIAKVARELGILTVGVVTKPFHFEGARRMKMAEQGIRELEQYVDTLIVIPNQNLFRVANEKTTFTDAFAMADQVLYSGVACITDLMVKEGLINLDFADVRAVMRDMGKAMMPLEVLNKPGKLTGDEYEVMKLHPERGHELLLAGEVSEPEVVDVCMHHHERPDGTGYPHRLKDEQISLFAKMGAVCDVYDAITSNRPYKVGWDPAESIARMAGWAKGQFDPVVFKAFVTSLGIYPIGSLVRLKSGMLAVVTQQNPAALTAPEVKAFFSTKQEMRVTPRLIDLSDVKCKDAIIGRESNSTWKFTHLDELWAGEDVLRKVGL